MTLRGEVMVKHGYCLAHLDALAKLAGKRAFSRTITDPFERTDIAWCGIVEALYTATERPTPAELVRAGGNAVLRESEALQYAHGRRQGGKILDDQSDRFHAYWWRRSTPSPEDGVVDRAALLQIWPTLKPWQREALVALAVHGDYVLAAEAVGVTTRTFYARVYRARVQFLRRWHEGETPAPPRFDRRRAGGPYANGNSA